MNITLALEAGSTRETALRLLSERGHRVTQRDSVTAILKDTAVPDVLVLDVDWFSTVREEDPMAYLRLSRKSRLVVVLPSLRLIDTAGILAFSDAFVFEDVNLDRLDDICVLAVDGHGLVPDAFITIDGLDSIRLQKVASLSDRERDVLRELGNARSNKQISHALDITDATVKIHVRSIMRKLDLRNRTEAAVFADRQRKVLDGTTLASAA